MSLMFEPSVFALLVSLEVNYKILLWFTIAAAWKGGAHGEHS